MNITEREMSISQGWEFAVVADDESDSGDGLDGLTADVFIEWIFLLPMGRSGVSYVGLYWVLNQ